MKITLFQSDKGDCLLVTSSDGKRMLVDGGMRSSYTDHVAAKLKALKKLDVVCVSHIDQDHISGVLQMLDDEVAWRVHDFQLKSGNKKHKKPAALRPPSIGKIWHNGFHEQISKNSGSIVDALSNVARVLSGFENSQVRELASRQQELATSIGEALQLSNRIGDGQLNIPLNPEYKGRLMLIRDSAPALRVGKLKIQVIAPFDADLRKLRSEWNDWLRDNEAELERLRKRVDADQDRMGTEVERLLEPLLATARRLGNRKSVTVPNLASLMLLVTEGKKTLLLTGDGHSEDIVKGLLHIDALDGSGKLHVNVLKVQHHGSEHNLDAAFCDAITADQYIFCGNGAHKNPDLDVVETLVKCRTKASNGNGVPKKFKLWFNSSSTVEGKATDKAHMKKVETLVARLTKASAGALTASFQKLSSRDLGV